MSINTNATYKLTLQQRQITLSLDSLNAHAFPCVYMAILMFWELLFSDYMTECWDSWIDINQVKTATSLLLECNWSLHLSSMSSQLMTDAHKYTLTRNRSKFVENLLVTEAILNILSEDYTLTADLREDIEVVDYTFP